MFSKLKHTCETDCLRLFAASMPLKMSKLKGVLCSSGQEIQPRIFIFTNTYSRNTVQ